MQRSSRFLSRRLSTQFSSLAFNKESSLTSFDQPRATKPDFDPKISLPLQHRSVPDLVQSLLVFQLCQFKPLVQNGERLLDFSRAILGDNITDAVIRETFFQQFCGGQNQSELNAKILDLESMGIGAILDYAAEDEGSTENGNVSNVLNQPAQVYDYHSEEVCDHHVSTFIHCIHTVRDSQASDRRQFAAMKVTALGNPQLMQRMSVVVRHIQEVIHQFDESGKGCLTREEFTRAHASLSPNDPISDELMEILDPNGNDTIDYVDWCTAALPLAPGSDVFHPNLIPDKVSFCPKAIELMQAMQSRVHAIAQEASKSNVCLLIDAEQSWFQPAIDVMSLGLQETYNNVDTANRLNMPNRPIIFNTYQCYLKDTMSRMKTDVDRSKRLGYHFGTKLVRGAYMQRERARAEEMGYSSPIQDSLQATHDCYNAAVEYLLIQKVEDQKKKKGRTLELMCATHNRESIELAIDLMEKYKLAISENGKNDSIMSFAQLYGMSDDLTIPLGEYGYNVYKYLPFGEIREVIPYLLRRAQENGDVLGKSAYEAKLVVGELKRRIM